MTVLIWPFFDVEVLSPSSSSSSSPPEHQKVHHNSASNDPRLLKFCVHLPYGITPGCFWIYCDRTSGCRPCLQKLIYDHNSATNDPRLLNFFLYTYLMILFKDILDLLQPRQRLPPSLQKLIYDHNSAINDHGLQNFFVHFSYEIIPRYFELITTASAVAALTSKNGSMIIAWQQMILGF